MGLANPKTMFRSLVDRFGLATPPDALKKRDDGFYTAKGLEALFPKTQPAVDGDDCLHDCATCTVAYPRKFTIDEEDQLYGHINGWSRHLIVATGKTDWVRNVEDEKGSVMEAVGEFMSRVEGGKLMLSASNMPVPDTRPWQPPGTTTVLLMPSFVYIDNVDPGSVPGLIKGVINAAPTNTTPLPAESTTNGTQSSDIESSSSHGSKQSGEQSGTQNGAQNGTQNGEDVTSIPAIPIPAPALNLPTGLSLRSCGHKCVILICSQGTRDARCGQTAPLLKKELERHLRPLGLYRNFDDERPGGVGIYFISHVGGHKYSANMMIYRRADDPPRTVQEQINAPVPEKKLEDREAAQCIWLARIKPEDIENVVRYTVLQGKVVKPERQLRGGFDRQRGIVSW